MQENSHYRQLNAACCKFEKSQKIILIAKELKKPLHFESFRILLGNDCQNCKAISRIYKLSAPVLFVKLQEMVFACSNMCAVFTLLPQGKKCFRVSRDQPEPGSLPQR